MLLYDVEVIVISVVEVLPKSNTDCRFCESLSVTHKGFPVAVEPRTLVPSFVTPAESTNVPSTIRDVATSSVPVYRLVIVLNALAVTFIAVVDVLPVSSTDCKF